MKKKNVKPALYAAIALLALLGAAVFFGYVPVLANECRVMYPELAHLYWPGLGFCWWIALLCYGMLFMFGSVVRRVSGGRSFCGENARAFRRLGALSLVAAVSMPAPLAFFAVVREDCGPIVVLLSIAGFLGFLVVALLAFPLAGLVDQAAGIQAENELTI